MHLSQDTQEEYLEPSQPHNPRSSGEDEDVQNPIGYDEPERDEDIFWLPEFDGIFHVSKTHSRCLRIEV